MPLSICVGTERKLTKAVKEFQGDCVFQADLMDFFISLLYYAFTFGHACKSTHCVRGVNYHPKLVCGACFPLVHFNVIAVSKNKFELTRMGFNCSGPHLYRFVFCRTIKYKGNFFKLTEYVNF